MVTPISFSHFSGSIQTPHADFETNLYAWRNKQGLSADETRGRRVAAGRIRDCFTSNATSLDLVGLHLTALPEAICSLTSLEELYLESNQLSALPPEICSLTSLQVLNLESNQLSALPPEIRSLTNLKELNLESNQLSALPPEICSLTRLEALYLKRNQLSALPPEICSLTSLKKLHLANNQLSALPPEICSLTGLKTLNLSSNELSALPLEICSLTGLKTLNLSSNELSALPLEICSLTGLEKLYLKNNQLSALPLEICSLTSLDYLDLSSNQLSALPPEISSLTSLKKLNLSGNQLSTLPLRICSLTSLAILILDDNSALDTLPINLSQCASLLILDTAGTRIPRDIVERVLSSAQSQRNQQASQSLPDLLKQWAIYAGANSEELQFILGYDTNKQADINEWLIRLGRAQDFQHDQLKLAQTACDMLRTLRLTEFQEFFFIQISLNNERCGDRAAMAFNELYVAYRLATEQSSSPQEQLQLLIGVGKTICLRTLLSQLPQMQGRREGVQVYLYYETHLQHTLGLVTAIQKMLHGTMGKLDCIDDEVLIDQVNAGYANYVVQLPLFDAVFNKDTDAATELSTKLETFYDESERIETAFKTQQITEGQYLAALNQCKENRETAELAFKIHWLQGHTPQSSTKGHC